MEQSVQVREHRLQQISTDLHNLMAELQALREAIRSVEAAQGCRGQEPIHAAIVAPPSGDELRV